MKKIIPLIIVLVISLGSQAQEKKVTLDYQNNSLNENEPLPAAQSFTLKGSINPEIAIVSVEIYKNHQRYQPVYQAQWRRPVGNKTSTFELPVDYKLHGNKDYDFVFHFYRKTSEEEQYQLAKTIQNNLTNYIESETEVKPKRISLGSPVNKMLDNMNAIVEAALTHYNQLLPIHFTGFSDIVKGNLERLNKQGIGNARLNIRSDKEEGDLQVKQQYGQKLKDQLIKSAMNEVLTYTGESLVVLEDVRERRQFPTERQGNLLAVNAGYGGVYLSGDWKDMDYDSAPYVGISLPLGNENISPFWGRTSVSFGVFLRDFKDEEGNKITGAIVGLPYYLGLGYKFLHILRLQAGVVSTSTRKVNNINNVTSKDFKIKPFIGLSAEVNLWLGFTKKN